MAKLVYDLYRYSVNENGIDVVKEELRHIDEVERGLACNFFARIVNVMEDLRLGKGMLTNIILTIII